MQPRDASAVPWGRSFCAALSLLLATASAAQASFPGRNGRIAVGYQFNDCDAELTIVSMRSSGSQRRVLTRPACDEREGGNAPDWSPDGRRLVYLTEEGEAPWGTGSRLAVMNSDGSGREILPIAPVYDGFDARSWYDDSPSLAPDGMRVAYVRRTARAAGPPAADIWISGLDGTGARRLRAGVRPRWSPDGRSIAYVTPNGRLRLMAATDGAVIRELAAREVCDVDWAPTGRRLVYLRRTSSGSCDFAAADVFVVHADGTKDRRLIRMPRPRIDGIEMSWRAQDVAWSPDGRRIAYVRGRDYGTTRYSLIITNARGRQAKVIYVTEPGLEGEDLPDYGPTIAWQPLVR